MDISGSKRRELVDFAGRQKVQSAPNMELREANGIFLFTPYKGILAWAFIVFGVDRLAIKMRYLGDDSGIWKRILNKNTDTSIGTARPKQIFGYRFKG